LEKRETMVAVVGIDRFEGSDLDIGCGIALLLDGV
jgi:hypothetical protein